MDINICICFEIGVFSECFIFIVFIIIIILFVEIWELDLICMVIMLLGIGLMIFVGCVFMVW